MTIEQMLLLLIVLSLLNLYILGKSFSRIISLLEVDSNDEQEIFQKKELSSNEPKILEELPKHIKQAIKKTNKETPEKSSTGDKESNNSDSGIDFTFINF